MTAQFTMRFPSAVTYAYTEVTGTAEELGRINPEMIAALFANAMFVYGTAERAAMERLKKGETALLPASQVTEAHNLTEEEIEGYGALLKEELGASEMGYTPASGGDREDMEAAADFNAPYKAAPPAAGDKPWDKPKPKTTIDLDDVVW